jgi:transcriptional regulator with XRE-family HTH domain
MPRKELTADEREVLAENWKTFGRFLRAQRIMRGFTQKRAALAAKVSTRQWVRYEQGSRVLFKRFPFIAKALNVSVARIAYLAGYKTAPKRNDANAQLRRIHDLLRIGRLDLALESFLLLYYHIGRLDPGLNSYLDGGIAPANFATAVISLDRLPKWLFEVIAQCMQKMFSERQDPKWLTYNLRRVVLKECTDEMLKKLSPLSLQVPGYIL